MFSELIPRWLRLRTFVTGQDTSNIKLIGAKKIAPNNIYAENFENSYEINFETQFLHVPKVTVLEELVKLDHSFNVNLKI